MQVAAWEESKRLSKQVEVLRKRVAGKQEEAMAARTEADKKAAQVWCGCECVQAGGSNGYRHGGRQKRGTGVVWVRVYVCMRKQLHTKCLLLSELCSG